MTEKERYPIARLPAYSFTDEAELKHQALLKDLCSLGTNFTLKCWDWDGFEYQHSINCEIRPSTNPQGSASIVLYVMKRYQSLTDRKMLEKLNYKGSSNIWTRVMLGLPSAFALANHALAGVKFGAAFKGNMGFKVQSEDPAQQPQVDAVLSKHHAWSMPATGDLLYLED